MKFDEKIQETLNEKYNWDKEIEELKVHLSDPELYDIAVAKLEKELDPEWLYRIVKRVIKDVKKDHKITSTDNTVLEDMLQAKGSAIINNRK